MVTGSSRSIPQSADATIVADGVAQYPDGSPNTGQPSGPAWRRGSLSQSDGKIVVLGTTNADPSTGMTAFAA